MGLMRVRLPFFEKNSIRGGLRLPVIPRPEATTAGPLSPPPAGYFLQVAPSNQAGGISTTSSAGALKSNPLSSGAENHDPRGKSPTEAIPIIGWFTINTTLSLAAMVAVRSAIEYATPSLAHTFPEVFFADQVDWSWLNAEELFNKWKNMLVFGYKHALPVYAGLDMFRVKNPYFLDKLNRVVPYRSTLEYLRQTYQKPDNFQAAKSLLASAKHFAQKADVHATEVLGSRVWDKTKLVASTSLNHGMLGIQELVKKSLKNNTWSRVIGSGIDIAFNSTLSAANAIYFGGLPGAGHSFLKRVAMLLGPGIVQTAIIAVPNTDISQNQNFTPIQKTIHRTVIGVAKGGFYSGPMASNAISYWWLKVPLQLIVGGLAVLYGRQVVRQSQASQT